MDLDAELLEFDMIKTGHWQAHDSWMVDAINAAGNKIDVKFIRKYWNVSQEKRPSTSSSKETSSTDTRSLNGWKDLHDHFELGMKSPSDELVISATPKSQTILEKASKNQTGSMLRSIRSFDADERQASIERGKKNAS